MSLINPSFTDMINTDGFIKFIELFEYHLKDQCCVTMTYDEMMQYLYKKYKKNSGIGFDNFDKDNIKLLCDACCTKDCCEYCTIRNLKHTDTCYHNVYDTTYEVLQHLIECKEVPTNLVDRIMENRRLCGLSPHNIHTITDGLASIVFKECQLLHYTKDEHTKILEGKYEEICIFCSNVDEST